MLKRIALFAIALTACATVFAQSCGLIPCLWVPTFAVGPTGAQFSVPCSPTPGTPINDAQGVFSATGASTLVQINSVDQLMGTSYVLNQNGTQYPGFACARNTHTGTYGCHLTVTTTPGVLYGVVVKGTATCNPAGSNKYWVGAQ
jgi:hypothetical protein